MATDNRSFLQFILFKISSSFLGFFCDRVSAFVHYTLIPDCENATAVFQSRMHLDPTVTLRRTLSDPIRYIDVQLTFEGESLNWELPTIVAFQEFFTQKTLINSVIPTKFAESFHDGVKKVLIQRQNSHKMKFRALFNFKDCVIPSTKKR